jgi:hypothetical protein
MLLGEMTSFIDDPRAPSGAGTKKPMQLVDAVCVRAEPSENSLQVAGWEPSLDRGNIRWLTRQVGRGDVVQFSKVLLPSIEQAPINEGSSDDEKLDADYVDDVDDGIANENRHSIPTGFQRLTTRAVEIDLGCSYCVEIATRKSRHTLPPRVSRSKAAVMKRAKVVEDDGAQTGLFGGNDGAP